MKAQQNVPLRRRRVPRQLRHWIPLCLWMVYLSSNSALGFLWFGARSPEKLRCQDAPAPEGILCSHPHLSWQLPPAWTNSPDRATAFQILVASSPERLSPSKADLWNSGRVSFPATNSVDYSGQPLHSDQLCYWKVRLWNARNRVSDWSAASRWSMGLLRASDWKGPAVSFPQPDSQIALTGADWIWFPEGHAERSAPAGTRWFRRTFELPAASLPCSACCWVTADNQFQLFFNGYRLGQGTNSRIAGQFELLPLLHPGLNVVSVAVTNLGPGPTPAGLLARVQVLSSNAAPLQLGTDTNWQSSAEELAGWTQAHYDDSTWLPARDLGSAGMAPWGDVALPATNRFALLRVEKTFQLSKRPQRAVLHWASSQPCTLLCNGQAPPPPPSLALCSQPFAGASDTNAVPLGLSQTVELTHPLQPGSNTLRIELDCRDTSNSGVLLSPSLRLQVRLEFADHSVETLVPDGSWQVQPLPTQSVRSASH